MPDQLNQHMPDGPSLAGRRLPRFGLGRAQARAQGMVEFALVLPLLLLLILGIIEVGRMLAIFSMISSSARQAARYGSVGGDNGTGIPYYLDCSGMRNTARRSAAFIGVADSDVAIVYDRGRITDTVGTCAANNVAMKPFPSPTANMVADDVRDGYRVVITVTATYRPIVPIVPLPDIPFRFVAARSIFVTIQGATPTPKPAYDLAITDIVDTPNLVGANNNVQYTVFVRNNGPSNTLSTGAVTLTQSVPSGWSYQGFSGFGWSGCSVTGSIVTCYHPANIDIGETKPITVTLRAGGTAGTYTTTARAVGSRGDSDLSNNIQSETTTVTAGADMTVTKSASPDPVVTGGTLTYTVTAVNNGPQAATGTIWVTDTLPSNVTYQSVAGGSMWTCSYIALTHKVTCSTTTDINAYNSGQPITIRVTAPITQTTFSNTAVITLTAPSDPDATNNTVAITTTARSDADLAITKSASATQLGPNDTLTYTLRVTNNGPSQSNFITVTDQLPSTLIFSSVTGSGWTCVSDGFAHTVTCTRPNLAGSPPTAAPDITIVTTVPAAPTLGTISNQATVAAVTDDSVPSNNTSPAVQSEIFNCHPGRVSAANSLVQPLPNPANLVADNYSTAQVLVTLKDDCGSLINTRTINVSLAVVSPSIGSIVSTNPVATSNGQALFTVKHGVVGTGTFQATADGVTINQTASANWICITGTEFLSLGAQDVRYVFTNNTGTTRRLSSLTVTFNDSSSRRMTSVVFTAGSSNTIWSGSTASTTLTDANFTGARTIANGASGLVQLNFAFNVDITPGSPDNYTVTAGWTDTGNASSTCYTPAITVTK